MRITKDKGPKLLKNARMDECLVPRHICAVQHYKNMASFLKKKKYFTIAIPYLAMSVRYAVSLGYAYFVLCSSLPLLCFK